MAQFGPILMNFTDTTGTVLDLRTLPANVSLIGTKDYNNVAWYELTLDGAGCELWIVPVVVAQGGTAPTAPTMPPPVLPVTAIHMKSGDKRLIGVPNNIGYDPTGQRTPSNSLATHLQIYAVTGGTAALLMVQGA